MKIVTKQDAAGYAGATCESAAANLIAELYRVKDAFENTRAQLVAAGTACDTLAKLIESNYKRT